MSACAYVCESVLEPFTAYPLMLQRQPHWWWSISERHNEISMHLKHSSWFLRLAQSLSTFHILTFDICCHVTTSSRDNKLKATWQTGSQHSISRQHLEKTLTTHNTVRHFPQDSEKIAFPWMCLCVCVFAHSCMYSEQPVSLWGLCSPLLIFPSLLYCTNWVNISHLWSLGLKKTQRMQI